jgi:GntR family transcriptional regulator
MIDANNSKVPLYYQLADTLSEQINEGYFKIGSKIPSERELCEKYEISRMTVRLAISELERQGKVRKEQGKGTFVLSQGITQNLNNLYSFSKEMEKQGKISTTKILQNKVIYADEKLANHLQIHINDKVVYLERLRCAEDVAIMIEKSWFEYKKFNYLLDIKSFSANKGLYKTLQDDHNIKIDRAIETFKATELTTTECKLLHCPKNQFGLLVKRTSYSGGQLISYSTIVSKGDIYEFTVELDT